MPKSAATLKMLKNQMRTILLLSSCMLATGVVAQDAQQVHPPGIELPEGEGRLLLLAACTRCHDLKGLPAYKGYWDETRWRAMIDTMVRNGAPLRQQQVGVLADYLAKHFGKGASSPD